MNHSQQETKKYSMTLKWGLILGIVVIINLFFAYSVRVVYDPPEFTDFCPDKQIQIAPKTQESCVSEGGQWIENGPVPRQLETGEAVEGYCNSNYECQQRYETASELYNRNVFIASVVVGILLIVGSYFASGSSAIAYGLSFGGVLMLIIGSMRYWSDMDDYLRVIILGIALAVLLWLGYKKFKD